MVMNRNIKGGRAPKEFAEEVINIRRVTRVMKWGRRMRFSVLVAVGNKKGKVGYGLGKSVDLSLAIQKAAKNAKNNLVEIKFGQDTIPYPVDFKYKGAHLRLLPAGPGTWVIAGGVVRKVLDLSGIENILSKRYWSANKLINVKTVFEALNLLNRQFEWNNKRTKSTK